MKGMDLSLRALRVLSLLRDTDSPRFERGSPGPKPGRMSWLPHESSSVLKMPV